MHLRLAALLTFLQTRLGVRLALQLAMVALRPQVAVSRQSIARPRLHATADTFRAPWRRLRHHDQPGRPAMAPEVRELSQGMGLSNPPWGSPRMGGARGTRGIAVAISPGEQERPSPRPTA